MDSIGEILKNERTNRGLSLQEVNDSTRITVQNLSALEENRFDYFPNRIYARAFLRDYANFLGLDSTTLLVRYEDGLSSNETETEAVPAKSGGSVWKAIGYLFLGLLVLAALAAALYYGSSYNKKHQEASKVATRSSEAEDGSVARLPTPVGVKPEDEKPEPPADTNKPAPSPVPDKVSLAVTANEDVWVRLKTDGQTAFEGTLLKGQTKTLVGTKSVSIRTGKAGAVKLNLNGKPQPALGTLQEVGDKTFTLEELKASGTNNPAAPATPAAPAAGGPIR